MPADEPTPVARHRDIRLLVLDIDGTITDSLHGIPAATRDAIARIGRAGIHVALATGRRYRDALPVATALGIDQPLVTASGGLIKRPRDHATLFAARFAADTLQRILGVIARRGFDPVVYTDGFAAGHDFTCRRLPAAEIVDATGLDAYLARNRAVARVRADLVTAPPADAFAGFAMGPREAMLEVEAAIAAACPGEVSLHTIRSPRLREWMCEFAPAGVTKWSGATRLAEALGITAAEICAVGDDLNDLPMIRNAGLGIAVGNAAEAVRSAAHLVVATSDTGALVEVADLLLAGRTTEPT
ncbi:MAG: HAD hydrolase family protein [Planctomycetaceae bacterium]